MDVGLVYHADYLKHDPGIGHPERAGRLEAVMQALEASGRARQLVHLTWDHDPQEWVAKVHRPGVLQLVQAASQRAPVALDPDTVVSSDSYTAALKAVAGTLAAADAVMSGQLSQVFCAVRPPGHHAESHRSMGFCLFNNVAILARYLQQRHGLGNILIIDWDVHHGNGTQHIFEDDPSVFYFSTHQYPFYPGTGATTETGTGRGKGYTMNVPLPAGTGDETYIDVFEQHLLPRALAYRPDCVLISAGFDAHYADPLAHMQVTEAGYRRMTQVVKEIAATCCQQRLIAVLEGGYNLDALGRSVEAHVEELQKDAWRPARVISELRDTTPCMRQIYLDHNATTPVLPEVLEAMLRYYREDFGNPSSVHRYGRQTRVVVDDTRDGVAEMLGAPASSIFFSSGGTEANNTILKGVAAALQGQGRHLVTSQIEHPAVLDTCAYLAQQGYTVTYVPVDDYGVVDPAAVRQALTDETILVSIMYANNETGVIQPIADIARLVRQRGILMHTDGVQAFGKMPLQVDELGVDFLSFSGHKLYAPKGIGGWYARPGAPLHPLLHGGHQERGMRSGTEPVAGIAALGKACAIARRDMRQEWERQQQLQQRFEHGIREQIPEIRIQGAAAPRLPSTTNVAFAGVEGEALMMSLDLQGVALSTGSACSSGSLEPSHVLRAMGVPGAYLYGALRCSLGRGTTLADIEYVLEILPGIVQHARALSPSFAP